MGPFYLETQSQKAVPKHTSICAALISAGDLREALSSFYILGYARRIVACVFDSCLVSYDTAEAIRGAHFEVQGKILRNKSQRAAAVLEENLANVEVGDAETHSREGRNRPLATYRLGSSQTGTVFLPVTGTSTEGDVPGWVFSFSRLIRRTCFCLVLGTCPHQRYVRGIRWLSLLKNLPTTTPRYRPAPGTAMKSYG